MFFPFKELQGMLSDKNENVVKNTLTAMGQLECAALTAPTQKSAVSNVRMKPL
jgi:hypothetical protein